MLFSRKLAWRFAVTDSYHCVGAAAVCVVGLRSQLYRDARLRIQPNVSITRRCRLRCDLAQSTRLQWVRPGEQRENSLGRTTAKVGFAPLTECPS